MYTTAAVYTWCINVRNCCVYLLAAWNHRIAKIPLVEYADLGGTGTSRLYSLSLFNPGMVASFLAFNRFAFIKFPDLWVENNGKEVNGTWTTKGRAVDFPSGRTSTYGSYLSWGYFYLILSIIVSMIVMSFTRCMRNKKEEQVYDVYNKKMKNWITNRGKSFSF